MSDVVVDEVRELRAGLVRSAANRKAMVQRLGQVPLSILKLSRGELSARLWRYQAEVPERNICKSEASREKHRKLHHFEPQGVTVLALLAESHLSVHTWPEHGAYCVDCFTCGERCEPERAIETIVEALGGTVQVRVLERSTTDMGE